MRLTISDDVAERLMDSAAEGETASVTIARLLDESIDLELARADAAELKRTLTATKRLLAESVDDVKLLQSTLADVRRRLVDTEDYARRFPSLSKAQERGIDKARADFHEFTGSYPEAAGE
jgi:hypothetical protein